MKVNFLSEEFSWDFIVIARTSPVVENGGVSASISAPAVVNGSNRQEIPRLPRFSRCFARSTYFGDLFTAMNPHRGAPSLLRLDPLPLREVRPSLLFALA